MRFWFIFLSALMLILSFSGGEAVATTAPFDPRAVEVVDQGQPAEESSDCPLSGTPHHHSCTGHNVAAPPGDASLALAFRGPPPVLTAPSSPLSGRSPPSELRPPIA